MNIGHEFMEVGAALADDRRGLEEQIHQHGLAAADFAENIEALDRLGLGARANSQPSDDDLRASRCSASRVSSAASLSTTASCAGSALDLPRGKKGRVLRGDGHRHARDCIPTGSKGERPP